MGLVALQQKEKRDFIVCARTPSENYMRAQGEVGCPQARHRALTRNRTPPAP